MHSIRRWLDEKVTRRRLRALERRLLALPPSDRLHDTRDAAEQVLGLRPRRSQLLAAQAMREGLAVELPTGEGKSLALALTAACLASEGRRVHIAYPNDYLAARDAELFEPFHRRLELSSTAVRSTDDRRSRRQAYWQAVVHGSARTLAFDLIGDDFRKSPVWRVTTPPGALLIDEIDALLVDDAITPLILSRPGTAESLPATLADPIADRLTPGMHYERSERGRSVELTAVGFERACELFEGADFEGSVVLQLALKRALEAQELWHRGEHYAVEGESVVLIDRATGRRAPSRRLSGGLHSAIEAKERLPVRPEPLPRARSSYRTILSRYSLVAGCSATIAETAEQLESMHGLGTVVVPSELNRPRIDLPDRFHRSDADKMRALEERALALLDAGRPVLLYVPSDAEATYLGDRLSALGPRTLTSGDEADEVAVLARAGWPGALTIATRLASRGTHIELGADPRSAEQVKALGGLAVVLGASPGDHRLERQIRGRAGRQGDPGTSEMHLSPGDPLPRHHLSDDERAQLARLSESEALVLHERARERAMATLESGRELRARIDRIADAQAEAHIAERDRILEGSAGEVTEPTPAIAAESATAVRRLLRTSRVEGMKRLPGRRLARDLYRLTGVSVTVAELRGGRVDEVAIHRVACSLTARWHRLRELAGARLAEVRERIHCEGYRRVLLATQRLHLGELDQAWTEHLLRLSDVEATIAFRAHERGDPIASFQRAAHEAFMAIAPAVEAKVLERLIRLPPLEPQVIQSLMLMW